MKTQFEFDLSASQLSAACKRNNRRMIRSFPAWWLIQILPTVTFGAASFKFFYTLNTVHARDQDVSRKAYP